MRLHAPSSLLAGKRAITAPLGPIWDRCPSFRAPGDFATFQLRKKDELRVILHRGAKVSKAPPPVIDDPDKRLQWLGADRAMLTVRHGDDVSALVPVLRAWMLQCAGGAGTGPGAAVMPSPQAVAR